MKRREFSPKTKQQADERARGRCEAKGVRYGLDALTTCHKRFEDGVRFHDHFEECREHGEGGDNSLENCRVVCKTCHDRKSALIRAQLAKCDVIAGRKPKPRSKWKWGSRPMPGTKASGWKKPMNGKAHRR